MLLKIQTAIFLKRMKKDYLNDVFKMLLWTLLFLVLFSFIPEIKIGSFTSRKVDMLSDIRLVKSRLRPELQNQIAVADTISPDTIAMKKDTIQIRKEPERIHDGVVLFEDYSGNESGLNHLCNALSNSENSPVRIAFLGDSFIEADILTQDIREELQSHFGGRGVGYVPMTSMTAGFRRTVIHQFNRWSTVSVVNHAGLDKNNLFIAGQYFTAEDGAFATFKGTSALKGLDVFGSAKFLFVNKENTEIKLTVNKEDTHIYNPSSSDSLQCIEVEGEITSLNIKLSRPSGFTAFGVYLNDKSGICVDNYSLRGTSGTNLAQVNILLSHEMSRYVDYDLIVLEYGQNVVSKDVYNYNAYADKMIKVVGHLKECYPETDILIMGVGDRSKRGTSGFETMPEIYEMIDAQRRVARETKSVFWDTFTAMGGENSMLSYVEHKPVWANKDYTHITHAGGRPIAAKFVEALLYRYNRKEDL